ncbi:glutamate dehydrogenase, putative [Entamoeba invadens IP1]|uniref:Glutamate dehydrogenase, putative n=1 Tax=Entamoeba invadens IP1 TaxID=370355 RepID=A0A0A1U3T2_ENTIV|nr:glutamate dehydrogenase, putative [Entamoeba invadens IP1]ELP88873.1 glutamate dehydrogenase, putative [Entamoeba invadens IP1]|eukprot:XP_004255644.1 glutamate dehydrogenase, putative [Entamoeba invadens IP1]
MCGVDYIKWLTENFTAESFVVQSSNKSVISEILSLNKFFENYLFLTFKTYAIVLSVDSPNSEERTLKHYKDKIILTYESLLSATNLPEYDQKLRVARVSFVEETLSICDESVKQELTQKALEEDTVIYQITKNDGNWQILFAWKNIDLHNFLYRVALVFDKRNIRMDGCSFCIENIATTNTILIGKLKIIGSQLNDNYKSEALMREFAMLREFYTKDLIFQKLIETRFMSISRCSLLRAFSALAEQFLAQINEDLYTNYFIQEALTFHANISKLIVDAFYAKFKPGAVNLAIYEKSISEIEEMISNIDSGKPKHDTRRKTVLACILILLKSVLKTNFFCLSKTATGFRLDPNFLVELDKSFPTFKRVEKFPEIPFGIFFVFTRNFFGFHVRFRDLARGGLRTVITRDEEQESYEKPKMFTECYNLAYTQQKKNKDIPEGGSKGIIFMRPDKIDEMCAILRSKFEFEGKENIAEKIAQYRKSMKVEYLYSVQRNFLKTFLSLFVSDENGKLRDTQIVDYYNIPEYIYLGPDENMHDSMIEWLSEYSKKVKYFARGAFISGKEKTGINHKEYGVTSLGVFEYLEECLNFLNIKKYTMKIKGGPNGDVAGNLIHLIYNKHKDRCTITSISSSACAISDRKGISIDELERLFVNNLALQHFDPMKMNEGGYMVLITEKRESGAFRVENKVLRKTESTVQTEWVESNKAMRMFETMVHKDVTDVFCPCGGRPFSLNEDNIDDFYVNNVPTSKMVFEGANLYFTPKAREVLEKSGVLIFKDSSANKCGVISSSYEILAGLALEENEFVEIKKEYAKAIVERLKEVARDEAKCMIDAYKNGEKSLVKISEMVSQKINTYTDGINKFLQNVDLREEKNKQILDVYIRYLPTVLREKYLQKCIERVPQMHMKAIIATSLATGVVYSKGLVWDVSIVDILPFLLSK